MSFGALVGTGFLTGFVLTSPDLPDNTVGGMTLMGMNLLSGAIFVDSFFPTTTERMADLWKSDPTFARTTATSSFSIKPMIGPFGGGLSGTF